jgi:hypothetical protein
MEKINFKLKAKRELKRAIKKGLKGFYNCHRFLDINFPTTITSLDKMNIIAEVL